MTAVIKTHAPNGFKKWNPSAKCIIQIPKVPIGLHEWWSCDGHNKLYKIGFLAYGFVDDATGKWLAGWIIPSNQFEMIVGYLYLCVIEKYGGRFSMISNNIVCQQVCAPHVRNSSPAHDGLQI